MHNYCISLKYILEFYYSTHIIIVQITNHYYNINLVFNFKEINTLALFILHSLIYSINSLKMTDFRATRNNKILVLFDVDGTLTEPREEASDEMKSFLFELRKHVVTGIVGGSDLPKQQEQVGKNVVNEVDYSFSENGLVAYHNGVLIGKQSIATHLGEENLKEVIKFALHYIADLDIPVKRFVIFEYLFIINELFP